MDVDRALEIVAGADAGELSGFVAYSPHAYSERQIRIIKALATLVLHGRETGAFELMAAHTGEGGDVSDPAC